MPTAKKSNKKRVGSREDLVKLLNIELLKIEINFINSLLNKFEEIIENYPLSPEECVDLLRENRSGLGAQYSSSVFNEVLDSVFSFAEGQYDNDIDNGDDSGFYFAFQSVASMYSQYLSDELKNLESS